MRIMNEERREVARLMAIPGLTTIATETETGTETETETDGGDKRTDMASQALLKDLIEGDIRISETKGRLGVGYYGVLPVYGVLRSPLRFNAA